MARLTADDQELARRELQDEAVQSGATAVTSCMRGEPVCVAGTLRAVTLRPRAGGPLRVREVLTGLGRRLG